MANREMKQFEVSVRDRDTRKDEGRFDRRFDAVDKQGRQFGATVRKFSVEYKRDIFNLWDMEGVAERMAAPDMQKPVGVRFFGFDPHATRGDNPRTGLPAFYGASQSDRLFATAEERDAAVEKYFATAEKGALKNKARVSGAEGR